MKQLIKDRKFLMTTLSIAIVCIFTLTIAYSALSAVLTINGNARVSAANWDIYLNNPRVTNGSATTNLPQIKTSSTLEFETTLNMPGDFYEFVVDVVNGGDIDAMIENVVKTPDLTTEQAKFLKYEVSYQNGESIATKQLLAKDTTMPIKVRIEYRKDLSNTDLPTGQVVLDLALTLEYIQSDGTGNSVTNNGVAVTPIANGNLNFKGTVITIGTEQFYSMGVDGNNVKMMSKMNITLDDNPHQSSTAGTTPYATFTGDSRLKYSDYAGSLIEGYVNNYKTTLESYGITISEARIPTTDELDEVKIQECETICNGEDCYTGNCSLKLPDWAYTTAYWTSTPYDKVTIFTVNTDGTYGEIKYTNSLGIRPLIVISKDYFN